MATTQTQTSEIVTLPRDVVLEAVSYLYAAGDLLAYLNAAAISRHNW
jgi:hypothetical protein